MTTRFAEFICSPLTHILNEFIHINEFPRIWKSARIVPINKVPNAVEISDFQPISILSSLSKVYEKIVLKQLIEFIESNNIYKDTVNGFRKGCSTSTALMKLKDDIKKAMKANEVTLMVLIDFSKAFDTICHNKLIKKMASQGFSAHFLTWTLSYLSDRQQFVQIDSNTSKQLPSLFKVTARSCKPANIVNTEISIKDTLNELDKWAEENSLAANAFDDQAREYSLNRVGTCSLLGLTIDEHFKWNAQIDKTLKKCYGKISVLRKLKNFTSFRLRKQLIETLIFSQIDYNDFIMSLTEAQMKRLQKLQKVACSFVIGRYAKIQDIIKLKWLPIKERREFNLSKLTYKAINFTNWSSSCKVNVRIK
ncbi:uncharacterized protein LOC130612880 [Hydractinia symbiolongicarpus]|uniref:uncharacterized protein LOC130612880 n=1 Tax=Hydractinia symbiolongicarpus TaxID=13093 RepID=UPI00254DB0A6|nr:uncharacterized protein LOC130612880 [Hydractinia symbiolongicarpus]